MDPVRVTLDAPTGGSPAAGSTGDGGFPRDESNEPTSGAGDSSLNRKLTAFFTSPVYGAVADHQRTETEWDLRPLAVLFDRYFDRFNDAFGLRLPRTVIKLDPALRRTCAGYFRAGHNEFGVAGEIAIAVQATTDGTPADTGDQLGTLLHEMLHLEQALTGTPGRHNYHNVAFRQRAGEFGLVVDERGYQMYAPDGRFLDLLREDGVPLPRAAVLAQAVVTGDSPPPPAKVKGRRTKSKLKKWTCGCTNVWVGVRVLHARCARGDCGQTYLLDSEE